MKPKTKQNLNQRRFHKQALRQVEGDLLEINVIMGRQIGLYRTLLGTNRKDPAYNQIVQGVNRSLLKRMEEFDKWIQTVTDGRYAISGPKVEQK